MLGATGSVGLSTLAVIRRHPGRFRVVAMSGHRSVGTAGTAGRRIRGAGNRGGRPRGIERSSRSDGRGLAQRPRGVAELAALPGVDVVVNAVVGAAGLPPTLAALGAGKRCALANKESLVAAGGLVLEAAREGGGELVPVDSEHSAILQCIGSARPEEVHRLILTASGGPFRETGAGALKEVTASMALRHPTWDMGAKITIDSATLANKALEVIEAHFLYGLPYERIEVVVHPSSIVHSFVEFVDGSVLSQMGVPTMELPILHALTWPRRPPDPVLRGFDPVELSPLAFEPVDEVRFPLFRLGVNAGRAGGAAPAVFNAANEVAVEAFLTGRVTFFGMAEVVEAVLEALEGRPACNIGEVLQVDGAARRLAAAEIERIGA